MTKSGVGFMREGGKGRTKKIGTRYCWQREEWGKISECERKK